jgi:hypothetical protein
VSASAPRRIVLALVLALAPAAAAGDPAYTAADPSAPAVTLDNLLASERFWPYQVELARPWRAEGRAQPLPAGTLGVLVRVEASRAARVDFGRDGLHEVAVDATDLVERANRIRSGALRKIAPNLVHAIGPRLVDAESPSLRIVDFAAAFEPPGFLCVFADPDGEGFAELARALAPLRGRHGVMTVLFPQGLRPDSAVRARLRALGWPVPFLLDQFGEGYTKSLLAGGTPTPAVTLQTREGRLIFQSGWSEGVVPDLIAALDGAFAQGGAAPESAGPRRASAP